MLQGTQIEVSAADRAPLVGGGSQWSARACMAGAAPRTRLSVGGVRNEDDRQCVWEVNQMVARREVSTSEWASSIFGRHLHVFRQVELEVLRRAFDEFATGRHHQVRPPVECVIARLLPTYSPGLAGRPPAGEAAEPVRVPARVDQPMAGRAVASSSRA